jgi:trehalose/maltose transport system permease protein
MSIASVGSSPNHDAPSSSTTPIYLVSTLLILIGLGSIVLFLWSILNDAGLQLVVNWMPTEDVPEQPSLILIFLERFGIIVPALIFGLGLALVRLGWKLRKGDIGNAYWAQTALQWMAVGLFALLILNMYNAVRLTNEGEGAQFAELLVEWIPIILGIIVTGSVWFWMSRNKMRYFSGEDLLIARETRLAWNLLIPTLTIFILVSARPLEQTFIRSLTDKRFAGGDVPQFVGLNNYTQLLSFRFDTVPCRLDDDENCVVRDDGSVRWESIERDLLVDGYRTVLHLPIAFTPDRAIALSGQDDIFLEGVITTIIFAVVSVSLELTIGLFIALVVNSNFSGRGIMRAIMLIPWAIPTVISARLWELMLKDTSAGIVNKVLMDLSLIDAPYAWLSEASLQLPTAIIIDVWKTAPFMALLLLAGLQTIPKDLYEAAAVDGANPVRRFFSVTLPLLRPAIAIALVFRTLDALRVFDLFNVLFGRQQLSMATYNFETLVGNQLDGYASAVSVIIFIFISIFAFIYVRMLNVET